MKIFFSSIILCALYLNFLYDELGRVVSKLLDEEKPAGLHTYKFNGSELAAEYISADSYHAPRQTL